MSWELGEKRPRLRDDGSDSFFRTQRSSLDQSKAFKSKTSLPRAFQGLPIKDIVDLADKQRSRPHDVNARENTRVSLLAKSAEAGPEREHRASLAERYAMSWKLGEQRPRLFVDDSDSVSRTQRSSLDHSKAFQSKTS